MAARNQRLTLIRTPLPRQAISDVVRGVYSQLSYEFLTSDGSPIGMIFAMGLAGAPSPGSPPGSVAGTWTIVGGTGAFVGARGTVNLIQCLNCRQTSQAEDPSMRRINGGGRERSLIQLFPMFRPEIIAGVNGPAVFHADYRPVTDANPAHAGETLIVHAKGLGPTGARLNPGDPFPIEPLAVVTSPVEVLVNGKSSAAINQIGVPGTTDTYRVDFRVPDDAASGTTNLQISAAWVKGAPVPIPVR